MSKFAFIDPHVHLWELKTGWYPHLEAPQEIGESHGVGDFSKLRGRDFSLDDYLEMSDDYEIVKMVHVTAAQAPPTWPDETRYLQGLFEARGYPHGIVGWTDFKKAVNEVDAELGEHAESPNFRGVRHHDGLDYTSDHIAKCFEVMQRRGLLYDTVANEKNLTQAAELAGHFGDVSFIVEHTGWPTAADAETFKAWRDGMRRMAEHPNAAVKISGLGMTMHHWSVEDLRPWIEATIEIFGVDRCMFASNFPVDWLYSDYDALLAAYRDITSGASDQERQALFVTNAERWYRI